MTVLLRGTDREEFDAVGVVYEPGAADIVAFGVGPEAASVTVAELGDGTDGEGALIVDEASVHHTGEFGEAIATEFNLGGSAALFAGRIGDDVHCAAD